MHIRAIELASERSHVPQRGYEAHVAALHRTIDEGTEPSDDDITDLSSYRDRMAERDIAQLFHRRACLREERIEEEQERERLRYVADAVAAHEIEIEDGEDVEQGDSAAAEANMRDEIALHTIVR